MIKIKNINKKLNSKLKIKNTEILGINRKLDPLFYTDVLILNYRAERGELCQTKSLIIKI